MSEKLTYSEAGKLGAIKICKFCSENFVNLKNRSTIYCSKCIERKVYNTNNHLCIEECIDDRSRKKFLLKEDGHICSICKQSEWMQKPIPIELDHINGNHQNNDRNNLRLVCPNCHAQTDTYKGKNVGKNKGRLWRKKYYKLEPGIGIEPT